MVVAYLKPQAFTRHVVNPLVSRLQTGGVATLTVPGRGTRRARAVPVVSVEVEDQLVVADRRGERPRGGVGGVVIVERADGVARRAQRGQVAAMVGVDH